ncbi:MAG TPA: hypothetical protein PLI30_12570 [Petrimonas sp.]|nr:hypothetical protein [Petrimonas sp.]
MKGSPVVRIAARGGTREDSNPTNVTLSRPVTAGMQVCEPDPVRDTVTFEAQSHGQSATSVRVTRRIGRYMPAKGVVSVQAVGR